MTILFVFSLFAFLFNLYAAIDLLLGMRKMRNLADIVKLPADRQPMVSIIVPACNEENTVEPALRTLLGQEYENLEIIVVNDRSTDRTGEVLSKVKKEHPTLRILEINDLPPGWLGKNHALHRGALKAEGDYLLFTDADILFDKTTIARAMTIIVREGFDHLALIFRNIARGHLLNAMMVDAGAGLFFLFKPWKVSDPKSTNFVGVGAFNLVKKSVYFKTGGHETIRMHPIDDIMLGKTIKQNGFRQECLSGYDFLSVHWYDSPGTMIRGLMKNIFALFNFRVSFALLAVTMVCLMAVFPFWGIFLLPEIPGFLCLATIGIRLTSFAYGARLTGTSYLTIPYSLLTPYINIFIILKGMWTTLRNNGINWRGTHYSLDELKHNRPIL